MLIQLKLDPLASPLATDFSHRPFSPLPTPFFPFPKLKHTYIAILTHAHTEAVS